MPDDDERGRQRISKAQIELAYLMLECIRDANIVAADMFDRPREQESAA